MVATDRDRAEQLALKLLRENFGDEYQLSGTSILPCDSEELVNLALAGIHTERARVLELIDHRISQAYAIRNASNSELAQTLCDGRVRALEGLRATITDTEIKEDY
jgi:hypothetical protein